MVSLHIGWLGVLEEAGPMLELIEEDRGMGTWRQGQSSDLLPFGTPPYLLLCMPVWSWLGYTRS